MTDPNWAEWINPFGLEFLLGGGTARVGGGTAQETVSQESVRTLADSKLGVDLFRGSASLELYRGSSLQVAAQRLQKRFIYCLRKEKEYMAICRASKP